MLVVREIPSIADARHAGDLTRVERLETQYKSQKSYNPKYLTFDVTDEEVEEGGEKKRFVGISVLPTFL